MHNWDEIRNHKQLWGNSNMGKEKKNKCWCEHEHVLLDLVMYDQTPNVRCFASFQHTWMRGLPVTFVYNNTFMSLMIMYNQQRYKPCMDKTNVELICRWMHDINRSTLKMASKNHSWFQVCNIIQIFICDGYPKVEGTYLLD